MVIRSQKIVLILCVSSLTTTILPFSFGLNFDTITSNISNLTSYLTPTPPSTEEMDAFDFSQEKSPFEEEKKEPINAAGLVKLLTRSLSTDPDGMVDIRETLQYDLYKVTHPISKRPINDLPQFYFYRCFPTIGDNNCQPLFDSMFAPHYLAAQLFYNETHKSNLTADGTQLRSYLNLENNGLLNMSKDFGVDLTNVLSLMGNMRIEERRIGIMVDACYQWDKWYLTIRAPVMYAIRNFFLDEAEKHALESDPIFNDLDPATNNEQEVNIFARHHLIADRAGVGDIRAIAAYQLYQDESLCWDLGMETTWPIAFAFKKGLYGNHFPRDTFAPNLDLLNLFDLVSTDLPLAEKIMTNFFISAVDRLSQILLETSLGNAGHIGIGLYSYSELAVAPKLLFKTRAVLECLLPCYEQRYYIKYKDPSKFALLNNPSSFTSEADLLFLQEQLIETLFPAGYRTLVFPGFIFKLTTAFCGTLARNWELTLGQDIWWQQQEVLGNIRAPAQEQALLRTNLARKPGAFQAKVFGSINYLRAGENRDWSIGFYGDQTIIRNGVGRDFNISIRFETNF